MPSITCVHFSQLVDHCVRLPYASFSTHIVVGYAQELFHLHSFVQLGCLCVQVVRISLVTFILQNLQPT
jgi:hypothetical protein